MSGMVTQQNKICTQGNEGKQERLKLKFILSILVTLYLNILETTPNFCSLGVSKQCFCFNESKGTHYPLYLHLPSFYQIIMIIIRAVQRKKCQLHGLGRGCQRNNQQILLASSLYLNSEYLAKPQPSISRHRTRQSG